MALKLRQTATQCLGLGGAISVSRGVFGFKYGPPDRAVSLKRQMELAKGKSVNMSIIFVGHRPGFAGTTTRAQAKRITFALQRCRELYGQRDVGIRKVYWSYIPEESVGAYTIITDSAEARALTDDWSAANDGLDVFFVQSILNAGGWSTTNGSCDKDGKGMTGSVIELSNSDEFTAILMGHEVGHYLGLSHANTITNLMGVDSDNDGIGELNGTSTNLTSSQGTTMKSHCSVFGAC